MTNSNKIALLKLCRILENVTGIWQTHFDGVFCSFGDNCFWNTIILEKNRARNSSKTTKTIFFVLEKFFQIEEIQIFSHFLYSSTLPASILLEVYQSTAFHGMKKCKIYINCFFRPNPVTDSANNIINKYRSVFKHLILQSCRLEFFHQWVNRQLYSWGGLFSKKIVDVDPYMGILIVQKKPKIILFLACPDIQIHTSP